MRTEEFFEQVRTGKFYDSDIYNYVQKMTDNFNEKKLNLLCDDFDKYISMKYEDWRATYSDEDIDKAVKRWNERGIELPTKYDEKYKNKWLFIRDFFLRTRWGKPISDEEFERGMKELFGEDYIPDSKVLDVNVLLGGFYYKSDNFDIKTKSFPLLNLRDILIELKRKHTSSVYRFDDKPEDIQINENYINWLKSEDTLEQLIEALIEQNLIKERETDVIIKDHFEPVRGQNKEPEPIEWLDNQNLLVYLFRNLYKNYLINPAGKKWQLVTKHFIKSNGEQFKSNTLGTEAGKQKDGVLPANGTNIIDNIIQNLSE